MARVTKRGVRALKILDADQLSILGTEIKNVEGPRKAALLFDAATLIRDLQDAVKREKDGE